MGGADHERDRFGFHLGDPTVQGRVGGGLGRQGVLRWRVEENMAEFFSAPKRTGWLIAAYHVTQVCRAAPNVLTRTGWLDLASRSYLGLGVSCPTDRSVRPAANSARGGPSALRLITPISHVDAAVPRHY